MDKERFVLLTKLQLPDLNPRTLYRSRLINLLYQNVQKKLIFICAGAGYGKTTLITQFVNEVRMPFVYYQLKKEDGDPSVFLTHLIAGIKNIYPDFGEKSWKLSHFFNLPPGMSGVVLGTFVNEIIQTINNDTYFIFDDYHTVETSSVIDSIVLYLLENMPKKLHIIICSRTSPSFSLTQLKSKDEVFEITTDFFRFTKEEIQSLFTALFKIKLNAEQIEWLYQHSEGWPAFLRLILQSYEITPLGQRDSFFTRMQENLNRIKEDIFNYFALEIFENESEENQKFLIDCSLIDYLNTEICKAITKRNDCQQLLEKFSKRNAFVFSLPDGNYRFHSLYQDFLKSRFLNEGRKKEIYNLVAEYYKGHNIEEALRYYILGENFSAAVKIIENVAKKMLEQGKYCTLVSSIEKLPADMVKNNPLVLKIYGEAFGYLGNQKKAKDLLNRALKYSKNLKLKAEILYSLSGVHINEGNLNLAVKLLKKVIKICPKNLYLLKASALNSLGAINNAIGGRRLHQAKMLFKEAFNIAQKCNYQALKTSVLNNWAMNEFKLGNLQNAYEKILPAVNLLKKYFSLGCGAAFFNGARIALLLGNKEIAERILENGSRICEIFNDPWSIANINRGYGLLYIEKKDLKKAKEFFLKALEVYEKIKVPWLIITTLIELCRIEIIEENLKEAEKIFERIKELKKGADSETIHILFTEALLKSAQKEYQQALEILNEGLRLSKKNNLRLEEFIFKVKLCSVLQKQNEIIKEIKFIKNLFVMADKMGYEYLLTKLLREESDLVNLVIKYRIKINYLYSCLKKYKLFNIVCVSFFGKPNLEINGEKVRDDVWVTEKTKKLFFYLLLNKDKELTRESLIDIFWYDAGLKKGYDSLRKATYNIRRTLKNYGIDEPILVRSGYYQLSPDLFVYSDIDELEGLIKDFERTRVFDKKKYNRFLNIYKKGFAQDWYDNWVLELGDKYKIIFEEIQNKLASQ